MKVRSRQQQKLGFSLVELLVGAGLLSVLALVGSRLLTNGVQGSKALSNRYELTVIKDTMLRRLDCYKTLGVSPPLTSALNCAAYANVVPRDKNNNVLSSLGPWAIRAGCNDNSVVLKATRPGQDPLTKKDYSTAQEATQDLFRGTSSFCREFFDPSYAKYVQYNLQDLGVAMGTDCPTCFAGDGDDANRGCRGVVNTNYNGYTFMATSACSRLCRNRGWSSGFLAECDDFAGSPNWRTHRADCVCIE